MNVQTIRARHKGHWFNIGTMRFFNTRLCESACYSGPGGVYFVTSESYGRGYVRRYSVRCYDERSDTIQTVGAFQAYRSRGTAARAAEKLARGDS